MATLGTFSVRTPPLRAGAIGVIDVRGDLDRVFAAWGMRPVRPGAVVLRDLFGTDTGLVARWDESRLSVMPHGGPGIVGELRRELAARGLNELLAPSAEEAFPEARSRVDALALEALSRSLSPRAFEVLLRQHEAHARGLPQAPDEVCRAVRRLIEPPLVVALGPPNIGKSTLCNALAGAAVSIVADEPGTTRDAVGVLIDLDGLVVRYVDAPGISPGASGPDLEAQRLALDLARRADLVLLMSDPGAAPLAPGAAPGAALPGDGPGPPAVRAGLRADLGPQRWGAEQVVSVRRGEGLAALAMAIRRALVPDAALTPGMAIQFWDSAAPPALT